MPSPPFSQGIAASQSFRFDTPSLDIKAATSTTAIMAVCPTASHQVSGPAGAAVVGCAPAATSCRSSIHHPEVLPPGQGLSLTPPALGPALSDGLAAALLLGMGTSIHNRLAVGQALLAAAGGGSGEVAEEGQGKEAAAVARPSPGAAPVEDDPDLTWRAQRGRDSATAALVAAQGGQGWVKQAGALAEAREEGDTVTLCYAPHATSNLPDLAPSSQFHASWSAGGCGAGTHGHQQPDNLAVSHARGQGGQMAQGLAAGGRLAAGCVISLSSPCAPAKPSLAGTLAPLPSDCRQVQL